MNKKTISKEDVINLLESIVLETMDAAETTSIEDIYDEDLEQLLIYKDFAELLIGKKLHFKEDGKVETY